MILSYKHSTFRVPLRWLRCLKRRMRWVRAAGGVVEDGDGNLLLIRRNGRGDLPKGKVEDGETLRAAALREVEEETGVENITAGRLIVKTYHIYNLYGGWHLKQTSWYRMSVDDVAPATKPQCEEGITACRWMAPAEWRRQLRRSYGTMRTLLKAYHG